MAHHADLLDAAFWQDHQARIKNGHVHDVFPYEASSQLRHMFGAVSNPNNSGNGINPSRL
jgi:isocitrate dehydrogenase kinase/phosphatase